MRDRQADQKRLIGPVLLCLLAGVSALGMTVDFSTWRGWREYHSLITALIETFAGVHAESAVLWIVLTAYYTSLLPALRKRLKRKQGVIFLVIAAGLFALFSVVGRSMIQDDGRIYLQVDAYHSIIWLFEGIAFFCFFLFTLIYIQGKCTEARKPGREFSCRHPFLFAFIFLFLCYLPVIILSYPGMIMGDTVGQIGQGISPAGASGEVYPLSNHHPILHSLLMNGCIRLGQQTAGSVNFGLFIYTLIQIFVTVAALSYAFCVLNETVHFSAFKGIAILAIWGLHPRIQNYVVLATKDVLFADFNLVFLATFLRWKAGNTRRETFPLLAISMVLSALFRTEGIVLVMAVLIPELFQKQYRKASGVLIGGMLAVWLSFSFVLLPLNGIEKTSVREILSVPLQQTARILSEKKDEVKEEELGTLSELIEVDGIERSYNPDLSDPVKERYKAQGFGGVIQFLSQWLRLAQRYPQLALEAFLDSRNLYLYPTVTADNTYSYAWSVNCMDVLNERWEKDELVFSFSEKLTLLQRRYESMRELVFSMPVISLVMTAAFYVWTGIFVISLLGYTRVHGAISMILFLMAQLAILLFLVPVDGYYFRYTYPLAIYLPWILCAAMGREKGNLLQ